MAAVAGIPCHEVFWEAFRLDDESFRSEHNQYVLNATITPQESGQIAFTKMPEVPTENGV